MKPGDRIWLGVLRLMRRQKAAEVRHRCTCNATARAVRHVQAQWVVAGIDKGE